MPFGIAGKGNGMFGAGALFPLELGRSLLFCLSSNRSFFRSGNLPVREDCGPCLPPWSVAIRRDIAAS